MRGAPHSGFCSDIVRIRARASAPTAGRPWRRRLFLSRISGSPGDARRRRFPASRSRRPIASRPTRVTATPRATGPLSPGAAVEVGTVAVPAVDAGVRGPRGAARHVTGSSLGALRERKSAQTSSRPEPTGSPSASSMWPTSTELLAGTGSASLGRRLDTRQALDDRDRQELSGDSGVSSLNTPLTSFHTLFPRNNLIFGCRH
jgi:hypothetical protein